MSASSSVASQSADGLGHDVRVKLLALLLMACTQATRADAGPPKEQVRCGWFENPTPANAWLTDRDGEWLIGAQGGHQAQGDWPSFPSWRWVRTNGRYGYGCTCMRVLTDSSTFTIARILSSSPRSLAACRKDSALTEPRPG
jgi:hypothetical protein